MATVIGSNGAHNYQGVTGAGYELVKGDVIIITWINESVSNLDLTSLLSLKSPLRVNELQLSDWHVLDTLSLNANSTATSRFEVTEEFAGMTEVINVSNAKI
jgi:hypothetical protein